MKFTEEQLAKIKAAKTAEELIALAKAEGIEEKEGVVRSYFDRTHQSEGEIADDELDNVAGGSCYSSDGRLIVSAGVSCSFRWRHYNCGGGIKNGGFWGTYCDKCGASLPATCANCQKCTVENGIWYCNEDDYRKWN